MQRLGLTDLGGLLLSELLGRLQGDAAAAQGLAGAPTESPEDSPPQAQYPGSRALQLNQNHLLITASTARSRKCPRVSEGTCLLAFPRPLRFPTGR